MADSNKRMVPRRSASLARIAVFMSSVICSFRLMRGSSGYGKWRVLNDKARLSVL